MSKAVIIAGTHSGVGKTIIVMGLIAALRRLGLTVQPFKVGPDYIDGTFHTLAANRPCRNIDTWLVPAKNLPDLFAAAADAADFSVVEGVMGLFDGIGYDDDSGSTAQIAKLLGLPVILVIDAAKMARSAAAIVGGFQKHDANLRLAGVILNRVGSDNHGRGVATAIENATGLPVLGWILRDARLHIAERHLGLVPALESARTSELLKTAEEVVRSHLDLDRIQHIAHRRAGGVIPLIGKGCGLDQEVYTPRSPVMAVARDEAFHFIYQENIELLQRAGAKVVFFSPLHDDSLPATTGCVILSGGFPEVFAAGLAANTSMLESMRAAHRDGLPIYAECGGLMYLTGAIVDQEGRSHVLAGILPGQSVMSKRLSLGYRRARPTGSSWFLQAGEEVHGHEFHYSEWRDRPSDLPPAYFLQKARGNGETWPEGAALGNLFASYVHLHFWGKPELADRVVAACRNVEARERVGVS